MPLSNEEINELKAQLLKMKEETVKSLQSFLEPVQELSNYDNHPADLGTELFERSKDVALREHAERQFAEIERALEKIEIGTYGICEVCQNEIQFERLKAHPTATRCVEHSNDQTVSDKRPIEEDLLEPPFARNVNEEENAAFDAEDTWQVVSEWGTSETPSDFFTNEKKDYNEMHIDIDKTIDRIIDEEMNK